jgi:hypothetical protein
MARKAWIAGIVVTGVLTAGCGDSDTVKVPEVAAPAEAATVPTQAHDIVSHAPTGDFRGDFRAPDQRITAVAVTKKVDGAPELRCTSARC